MSDLHQHYDQLTDDERDFVDRAMRLIFEFRKQESEWNEPVPELAGDDRSERAADGLAQWVIESRKEVAGAQDQVAGL